MKAQKERLEIETIIAEPDTSNYPIIDRNEIRLQATISIVEVPEVSRVQLLKRMEQFKKLLEAEFESLRLEVKNDNDFLNYVEMYG